MTTTPTPLLLACTLAASLSLSAEDRISLLDGSNLRGTVRQIEDSGKVIIDSAISAAPIQLRGEALRSIKFESKPSEHAGDPHLLHLANGDILPGTLQSLDDKEVRFTTWFSGDLTISRRFIKAIDFGITPQKRVYSGPDPQLTRWSNVDNWEVEGGNKLVCNTSGTITLENILPKQFILRCRLEWENGPNFRIYFCDDFLKRTGKADRYYFEFNAAGSQLKRQTSQGDRQWHTLAQSHRRPEEFNRRKVDIELRVDRERRQIITYLDGEKLQRTPDSIDEFPTGSGIMLQSQAGGELKNIVSRIEIYEWDAITELRRDEGHDDPTTDGLVDIDGEHISGDALRLESGEETDRIIFQSPFNPEALKVATNRISSIYFKEQEEALPDEFAPIQFLLQGAGELQLKTLILGEEVLSATHPLLGNLTLDRKALEQLVIRPQPEEPASDQ